MSFRRIWIFGGTGSGKTTFAKKLSDKMGIPFYTTDMMIYSKNFNRRYSDSTRDAKLKEIGKKRKWIIEGVHRASWILPAFNKSDLVIIIDTGIFKRVFRTLRREMKNKKTSRKKDILKVLYYAIIYPIGNRPHHFRLAKTKKIILLKDNKEINDFLEKEL